MSYGAVNCVIFILYIIKFIIFQVDGAYAAVKFPSLDIGGDVTLDSNAQGAKTCPVNRMTEGCVWMSKNVIVISRVKADPSGIMNTM